MTFWLLTQSYPGQAIASGTLTAYGWLATWDTTTVPNGIYSLYADVAYASGQNGLSNPVSITVNNPLPTASILSPSKTTTLAGSTTLDAAASNAAPRSRAKHYLRGCRLGDELTPLVHGHGATHRANHLVVRHPPTERGRVEGA